MIFLLIYTNNITILLLESTMKNQRMYKVYYTECL